MLTDVRVATFNVLHGEGPDDGVVDLARYADAVASLDADVVALQEVDRGQPRSHEADLAEVAAAAMGAVDVRFVPAMVGLPGRWRGAAGDVATGVPAYGIALLSRRAVTAWTQWRLPRWPGEETRVAVAARLASGDDAVTVVATHLTYLQWWNGHQLRHLARVTAGDGPRIVLGDLNLGAARAARVTGLRGVGDGPTWPSDGPRRRLDHVLVDPGLEATGARVVRLPMSDHCAVVADVTPTRGRLPGRLASRRRPPPPRTPPVSPA